MNFALYSENATGVELCLFDGDGAETRVPMTSRSAFVWHGYAPGVKPGQRYGFRVDGPYAPERGLRFNPHLVLLDPYARAIDAVEDWEKGCFAYEAHEPGGADADLSPTEHEQTGVPRGVVIDPTFDWEGDEPPRTPLHRSVIYEAHVRGLTKLHPDVPEALRGTYAGLAHPAIIRHLHELGVTAIELMPVHAFVDDKTLKDRGLRNYWGYSTIGYFAPDVRYRCDPAVGSEVREFKSMVKAFHRAGIEVILDVVYNHTAEGNHLGPTFNFKGIDNPTYYRLVEGDPRFYFDYTGTGNTLNVRHPQVLTMIMDSLRYWANDLHVDGFRFDLASALARQLHDVDQLSSFFTLIHQSPQLQELKMIAEPWDVGEGGYQVGNFPVRWAEWNGRYRDAVRRLWRGDGGAAAEIGYRFTGSSDLYESSGRRPSASVNLITAHDGFTLNDLVSYNEKHNEANGENNQDGSNDEHSWNCGAEGETTEENVLALRRRQRRNLLGTLFLSQGTPMLLAGDEFGRTQQGNNNAYCQDNGVSWVSWDLSPDDRALFEFTKKLIQVRRSHPGLRRAKFFQGRSLHGTGQKDLLWFRLDGEPMSEEDWGNPVTKSFGMFLAGRGIDDLDERGRPLVDDNLFVLLNASHVDLEAKIPVLPGVREAWELLVDTGEDDEYESRKPGEALTLGARTLQLYRAPSRVIRAGSSHHALTSTYRLQLTPRFGFRDAERILDYLQRLGITDVYLSPIFQAVHGSTHGYDVVDHRRLNEELGGEQAFVSLAEAAHAKGLGILVDWVPNHMGITGGENPWWDDVLENGPSSIHADAFDIDWSPPRVDLKGQVLLPILGEPYGVALEKGQLQILWDEGVFRLAYYERHLPLGPQSMQPILEAVLEKAALPDGDPAREELESILTALRHLPGRDVTLPAERRERAREKEVAKRRFAQLVAVAPAVEAALRAVLAELNGVQDDASSFDRLDRILQNQSYRLASWQVAAEEINYRRFFDVNDLAAIRMEASPVFEAAHAALFRLVSEKRIDALRLDHTDGLYDPYAYLEALQHRFMPPSVPPDSSPDDALRPLSVLVEKILEPGEQLPVTWPVDGTTGYDFAAAVGGLWVDPRAEGAMTRIYRTFTQDTKAFAEHVYESKRHILRYSLGSEVQMLAGKLARIASKNRRWRDFTRAGLTRALEETLAAFEVYRTYIREDEAPSEQDLRAIHEAIQAARRRAPSVSTSIFRFIEDILSKKTSGSDEDRAEQASFALRFQQLTGPAMAKSVEDTAFYRYNRLVCLNEVGGTPSKFGTTTAEFHQQCGERARSWPLSMVATSTHDTKRGEDTGARIAVLSELPDRWRRTVDRWAHRAVAFKTSTSGHTAPPPDLEYLFYQTLVGAWPVGWDGSKDRDAFAKRLKDFVRKASKEAKVHTSWTNPNPGFDEALDGFVDGLLEDDAFVEDVRRFSESIGIAGAVNGLAQTVLRLASPGVPDTYQGSELWNQALVDPDNRSAVDYGARDRLLASLPTSLEGEGAATLLGRWTDGAIKLFVTRACLDARRAHKELFLRGDYQPLPSGEHVVAFTRGFGDARLMTCVARLSLAMTNATDAWPIGAAWGKETIALPYPGRHRNLFTGATVTLGLEAPLATIFADLPVALLIREREAPALPPARPSRASRPSRTRLSS